MTETRRPGSRLEQALEIFLQAPPSSRGDADRLLQQHPDLHEVLAPMVSLPLPGGAEGETGGERVLGDFRLVREIGRGAMGVVYEAWQRSLDRRVAVKVLTSGLLASPSAVARFRREAAAAARLQHPNIVEIHGFGDVDGEHFFAMQFVDGRSLHERMADWRTPEQAVRLATQVAAALAHAHDQGLVHRDVKPANVLIGDDGSVLLTDFGVARDASLPSLTREGGFVGTLDYAAPEQIRGERVDGRADVWSLGVILYELLHGARPFTAVTQEATMRNILVAEPPPLRGLAGVSTDLAAVVDRALQKNPVRRYASAAAMLQDLRALQRGDPVSARLPTSFERMLRFMRREPWRALAAAVTLVAVPVTAASAGYLWANGPRIRAAAAEEQRIDRDDRLARAWFDRAQGRPEAALAILLPLPDADAEVAFTRSRILLDLHRDDEANALLRSLPQPSMELTQQALAGRMPSIDRLTAASEDPFDCFVRAVLLFESSRGHTAKGRALAAAELMEHVMLVSPRPRASDAVHFAFLALNSGDRYRMVQAERVLAAHFAANTTARRLRAMLLAETDPKAALAFIAAMPADPDQAAYLASARGRAHEVLGDTEAAAAAYREALTFDEDRGSDWANLGAVLRKQKHFAEAIAALRRATALRPRNPFFANLLALALRDAGEPDAAEAMFAAAAQDSDYAPASYNLGNLRLRRGDLAGGIAALRRAVELDPTDGRSVANLGDALARAGDKQEALAWSLRAAELAPRDLTPQYNVANLALDLGLDVLALQAARRAQQNEPDNAYGFEILASALLAQQVVDATAALAAARTANDLRRGRSLDARLLVARALFAGGSRDAAVAELEAARSTPEFAAEAARARIDELAAKWRDAR
ncbi:MAG: protein kinase [Planctomycetes bacterium]|nr:protein kinase [Planctomycetota bacterium]